MSFRWSGQKQISEVFQVFSKHDPQTNHEKTTFRAFHESKRPRDPPWVQERQILFRIALTRALYDQMAPQLCLFYVPGSGPSGTPGGTPGGTPRRVRGNFWFFGLRNLNFRILNCRTRPLFFKLGFQYLPKLKVLLYEQIRCEGFVWRFCWRAI